MVSDVPVPMLEASGEFEAGHEVLNNAKSRSPVKLFKVIV